MKSILSDTYSISLHQTIIDADHILLTAELAGILPDQFDLILSDDSRIKVTRQEEIA